MFQCTENCNTLLLHIAVLRCESGSTITTAYLVSVFVLTPVILLIDLKDVNRMSANCVFGTALTICSVAYRVNYMA